MEKSTVDSSNSSCLFCKIVNHEIPSRIVEESTLYVAFHDIHPKAPVHVLIVPKRHVERPSQLSQEELSAIFQSTEIIAKKLEVDRTGFRLLFNVGTHPGQVIDHAHLHLIGGKASQTLY